MVQEGRLVRGLRVLRGGAQRSASSCWAGSNCRALRGCARASEKRDDSFALKPFAGREQGLNGMGFTHSRPSHDCAGGRQPRARDGRRARLQRVLRPGGAEWEHSRNMCVRPIGRRVGTPNELIEVGSSLADVLRGHDGVGLSGQMGHVAVGIEHLEQGLFSGTALRGAPLLKETARCVRCATRGLVGWRYSR